MHQLWKTPRGDRPLSCCAVRSMTCENESMRPGKPTTRSGPSRPRSSHWSRRVAEIDNAVQSQFAQAKVEPRDRVALAARIDQLAQWKEANTALHTATTAEALVRSRLVEQHALVALADEGERARLQADLQASTVEADEHTRLIQQQTEIRTRLGDAGTDGKLEQAAAEESPGDPRLSRTSATKRCSPVATRTLLDDVERAFEAEHETDRAASCSGRVRGGNRRGLRAAASRRRDLHRSRCPPGDGKGTRGAFVGNPHAVAARGASWPGSRLRNRGARHCRCFSTKR